VNDETAQLSATDAERISRLRIMLADAQSRITDPSGLGQHLSIIGIDGVGELAIGLCAHKRGVQQYRSPLPKTLTRLLEDLEIKGAPGEQGFRELHEARNQVQHQGILPSPDHLPRWLDETAALVTFVVERCFGVDLATVGSATAVKDAKLSELLGEAERAIEEGNTTRSFDRSAEAIRIGLTVFKRDTGLGSTPHHPHPGQSFEELTTLNEELISISQQLELSLFASEPGEWMWFEQRRDEAHRGLEPSIGEARRGFVFALGWVLRMESYVARHGPDRWERWNKRRAPETDLPGGPHIKDVSRGHRYPRQDDVEWIFQLTDVPDYENPDFSWGISAAYDDSVNPLLKHVYLDRVGKLVIHTPEEVDPEELVKCAKGLISDAKQIMERRWREDEEEEIRREALRRPFEAALSAAGLPVRELLVRPEDRGMGPLVVFVELADVGVNGRSWFEKCLRECFDDHLEGFDQGNSREAFAGALVPAEWPAEKVVAWLAAARERANAMDRADEDKRIAERAAEDEVLSEMKAQLDGGTQ
jgi:hypothetical protein